MPKFLCIKAVLFMTFWQSVMIAGLVHFNLIHEIGTYTTTSVSRGLQNLLICFEMFLAALAHRCSSSRPACPQPRLSWSASSSACPGTPSLRPPSRRLAGARCPCSKTILPLVRRWPRAGPSGAQRCRRPGWAQADPPFAAADDLARDFNDVMPVVVPTRFTTAARQVHRVAPPGSGADPSPTPSQGLRGVEPGNDAKERGWSVL